MGVVASTSAESFDEARIRLVEGLRSQRPEIQGSIIARIRDVASTAAEDMDVQYEEGQRTAVVAALDYALSGIERGEDWDTPIPSEVVAQARRAARTGVGLDTILRRYTAGHALLGDFVMQATDRGDLLSHGAMLRAVQRTQAALLDRLIASISDEYVREVQRAGQSPEQRRAKRVRGLLAGGLGDFAELDYELNAWHLGVIGTGVGAGQAIRGLAAGLDCQLLCVSHDELSVWAWLGGRSKTMVGDVERPISARWSAGVSLVVGEPAQGLVGWRLTHWQAQDALLVSLHQPQTLTLYADVALLAPWLRDDARARGLVEMYLSPLDSHRCSGVTLRETLREYFAAGRNASAAGRAINVSRRTMRNRMVLIEESLGSLLDTNQAELELALRLDKLLNRGSQNSV
jgi:hypothetical protein